MEENFKLLGRRVKFMRMDKGISQTKMAEMLGLSQTNLSNMESGRTTITTRNLFKMKDMGYFETAKGVVFGRVVFPGSFTGMSYADAAKKILGDDLPMVFDADIGHVPPKMTVINGALGHLESRDGKGCLRMELA